MVKDQIQYTTPGVGLAGRLLYVCLMVTLCLPLLPKLSWPAPNLWGCKVLYLGYNLWYNVLDKELMSGMEQASWK